MPNQKVQKYVYVLVSSYNDYDQHGEYLEDLVFEELPSIEVLAPLISKHCGLPQDIGQAIKTLADYRDLKEVTAYNNNCTYRFVKVKVLDKNGE